MGCCHSHPASSGADAETQQLAPPGPPAPAPFPPVPAPASAPFPTASHPPHPAHHHHHRPPGPPLPLLPLDERPNHPLRARKEWRSRRSITSVALQRAREEFWETRVTGRREVWEALRAAVEMLSAGEIQTAQSIVDAAGCSVPTGDLARGVYDHTGGRYDIPEYCLGDPVNVVTVAAAKEGGEREEEGGSEESDGETGKGKELGRAPAGPQVMVKARLSDRGGPDVAVKVEEQATVRRVTALIEGMAKIPKSQRISLVYLGRILEENKTLTAQGWKRGDVVNALVRSR